MSRDFNKNKVAVLTGAAKKIGRSTAIKLAEQGFNILIHTGGKSIEEANGSCSACANKSDAIWELLAVLSAMINISLGPANESIPVNP